MCLNTERMLLRVAARQTLDSQKNETHVNQLIYSAIIITVIISRQ